MHLMLVLLFLSQADPAAEAVRGIDEAAIRAHVEVLAADAMEGRAVGRPGNDRAAEYIVKQLKEAGLKPAGDGGDFHHLFPLRRGGQAKNVIALLEGADGRLKDEYVAVGGHFDHVGMRTGKSGGQRKGGDENDLVFNGADDNASGTAAVLDLARPFAAGPARPKRSILFCLWNAEETGLEGSSHWTRMSTRPLDKLVYYLNLDMVGRNPERPIDFEGAKNSGGDALERIVTAACEAEGLRVTKYDHHNEAMFRADGAPFLRAGVPASMFFSYWHADYHKVSDHADKVAFPNLAKVARASFRILLGVADHEPRLRFNPNTPLRGKPLGVEGEELEGEALKALNLGDGQGAYRIRSAAPGQVMSRAGFQDGDVLLGLKGRLPDRRTFGEFWLRVQSLRPGQEVDAEVLRGGERKVLTVRWPE